MGKTVTVVFDTEEAAVLLALIAAFGRDYSLAVDAGDVIKRALETARDNEMAGK